MGPLPGYPSAMKLAPVLVVPPVFAATLMLCLLPFSAAYASPGEPPPFWASAIPTAPPMPTRTAPPPSYAPRAYSAPRTYATPTDSQSLDACDMPSSYHG